MADQVDSEVLASLEMQNDYKLQLQRLESELSSSQAKVKELQNMVKDLTAQNKHIQQQFSGIYKVKPNTLDSSCILLYKWTPLNSDARLQYDRGFLLQLQFSKVSMNKPDCLPIIPELIPDKLQPKTRMDKERGGSGYGHVPGFTPGFLRPSKRVGDSNDGGTRAPENRLYRTELFQFRGGFPPHQELERKRAYANARNQLSGYTPLPLGAQSRNQGYSSKEGDPGQSVDELSEEEMEMKTVSIIDEYLHSQAMENLEFTVGPLSAHTTASSKVSTEWINRNLTELLLVPENDNEKILDWIETNIPVEVTKENRFIRALMNSVCSNAIVGSGQMANVDEEEITKWRALLLKYIHHQPVFELQALFALQALVHSLEHPSGVLRTFFDTLYDKEIISETTFIQWKISKEEPEGKERALKQVVQFFARPEEFDS